MPMSKPNPLLVYHILGMVRISMNALASAVMSHDPYGLYNYALEHIENVYTILPPDAKFEFNKCMVKITGEGDVTIDDVREYVRSRCDEIMSSYEMFKSRSMKEGECLSEFRSVVRALLTCVVNALHNTGMLQVSPVEYRLFDLGDEE